MFSDTLIIFSQEKVWGGGGGCCCLILCIFNFVLSLSFFCKGADVKCYVFFILYFHIVINFRLLLSICGYHFLVPLNLKMLPTPLL